jgi:uncharacterized membrane protein YccF (DUF307 family)
VWFVFIGLALGLTVLVFSKTWRQIIGIPYFVILYFIGCIAILPLDKFLDERFRKLEKLRDEKAA